MHGFTKSSLKPNKLAQWHQPSWLKPRKFWVASSAANVLTVFRDMHGIVRTLNSKTYWTLLKESEASHYRKTMKADVQRHLGATWKQASIHTSKVIKELSIRSPPTPNLPDLTLNNIHFFGSLKWNLVEANAMCSTKLTKKPDGTTFVETYSRNVVLGKEEKMPHALFGKWSANLATTGIVSMLDQLLEQAYKVLKEKLTEPMKYINQNSSICNLLQYLS